MLCKTCMHQASQQKSLQWEEGRKLLGYCQVQAAYVKGPAASPHLVPQFPLSKAVSAYDFLCAFDAKCFLFTARLLLSGLGCSNAELALAELSFVLIIDLKFPDDMGRTFRTLYRLNRPVSIP